MDLELTDLQKKRVELLVDQMRTFTKQEYRYFAVILKEKLFMSTGLNVTELNMHWPAFR